MSTPNYDGHAGLLSLTKRLALEKSHGKLTKTREEELRREYGTSELHQRFARQGSFRGSFRIAAPPRSFQVDIAHMEYPASRNRGFDKLLVTVDIPSRYAIVMPTKGPKEIPYPQMSDWMQKVLDVAPPRTKSVPKIVNSIGADDAFNTKAMVAWCTSNDIALYTDVAKEDHLSKGDKLGIIDRFTRTLKDLINKHVTASQSVKWIDALDSIVDLYNQTPHSALGNRTPAEVWNDPEQANKIYQEASDHNRSLQAAMPPTGTTVRTRTPKATFAKEGARFSAEVSTVKGVAGNKVILESQGGKSTHRKPQDLLVTPKETLAIQKSLEIERAKAVKAHAAQLVRSGLFSRETAKMQAELNIKRGLTTFKPRRPGTRATPRPSGL